MNVMWYVGRFDEATWVFFAENGLTAAYLTESGRGMAAVEQNLRYHKELHAGDVIHVTTRLLEATARKIRVEQRMVDDSSGDLAATCGLVAVHTDTRTRQAVEFEAAIAQGLAESLAANSAKSD
jgi:acyl-CoA thioester hydrolase